MKLVSLMTVAVMLFCLTALLNLVISPALAGVGCGTNWMGDTSQDTDFWVSKNQNAGAPSPSISEEGKPIKAAMILSLTPDNPSPQLAGTTITWSAKVSDRTKDAILYDFYLKGPSTNGLLADKTGWTAKNSWTWNTAGVSAGNYQVEVRVKEKTSTKEFDDQKSESYLIEDTTKSGNDGNAVAKDSHPLSTVSDNATEEPNFASNQASNSYDSATPNMNMPDTKPIPLTSETTASSVKIGSVDSAKGGATASNSTSTSTQVDSHPASRTAESTAKKTRLAPDERPKPATSTSNGPNMDMPDTKPIPLTSASAADADVQAETAMATDTEDDQTSPEMPTVMDVEGKWTIGLKESGSTMDLILIQSGETIMGSGTLNDHGNKIPLMASGSVAGNSIKLDVKTVVGKYVNQIDKSFNLDLVKVDRQISGSYEAYSGESLDGQGKVTASRFST
jgi:hypothetical protein